ncbi:transglutaminase domain-containing protein [Brachybacterium sp. UNK5269]|uniref:transglutaminase domain-containing protein n=1 Tax=Brachybacterium sp. UNK5269 TaxID=3408576 RepID=UPI003BAE409F
MAMTLSTPPVPADWARHTAVSDPGEHARLWDAVAPTPEAIGPVVRNLLAHYRVQAEHLPASSREDVDLRWVRQMLAVDQQRHPGRAPAQERVVGERLQGCCRDSTLLAVSILRHHGVPARSRVGFAHYFAPDWHHDHVIVEFHDGRRWRRFDPEVDPAWGLPLDPLDVPGGPDAPFTTAAEALRALRRGTLDASRYGVAPGHEASGEGFVLTEIFLELAHRYGDEVLLWDAWGALPPPAEPLAPELLGELDEIAADLVAADGGDADAEQRLFTRYRDDERLHPAAAVLCCSPVREPVRVSLQDRSASSPAGPGG